MIVALDGVSESSLARRKSLMHLFEAKRERSRLSSSPRRPNDRYRKPITAADHWIRAEPQRLDEDTLALFEAKYLHA